MQLRLIPIIAVAVLFGSVATGAPAKKKYHFELTAVLAKPEVKPEVAKSATPRVEAQIAKAFSSHPQLVGTLEGAPDPKTSADAYRKYLVKSGISGSYLVTVEITEATEELVPMEGKGNSQRLNIHIALHMLGEHIPDKTIAFTGDGQATIKQEVGKIVRDKDREFTWDGVAELAVHDAIETSLHQLGLPPPPKK